MNDWGNNHAGPDRPPPSQFTPFGPTKRVTGASEVIRAAILAVPRGQWEAGQMIGMSNRQTLARIILPQAARVSVPPLSNTFISLVLSTAQSRVERRLDRYVAH